MVTGPTGYLERSDASDFCLEDPAAGFPETLEPIYKTARPHNPEGLIITAV
jgi:hypothetical protein